MWESDHQEDWVPKNPCFWTVVLEKTLESPLDCKEIKQVNLTGNQPWIFIGKTDAEDEAPILWLPDAKSRLTDANSRLTGKDPDAAKDWQQEGKWVTEDEMVGWHHWLNGQSLSKLQEIVKAQFLREDWVPCCYWEEAWMQWWHRHGCRMTLKWAPCSVSQSHEILLNDKYFSMI